MRRAPEQVRRFSPVSALFVLVFAALMSLSGCAETDTLPPLAQTGRDLVRTQGCAACHGADGQGGIGPAFVGLFESEVTLDSGETVIANRDYLIESILNPAAAIVDGYSIVMPSNSLTPAQAASVADYIEYLGEK
jgi:mono/diheme cytochrome c family protein